MFGWIGSLVQTLGAGLRSALPFVYAHNQIKQLNNQAEIQKAVQANQSSQLAHYRDVQALQARANQEQLQARKDEFLAKLVTALWGSP